MQGVVKLEQVQDQVKLLNQQKVIHQKVKVTLRLQDQQGVKAAAREVAVLEVVQEAVAQKVILQVVVLDHRVVQVLQEVQAQAEVVAEAVVEVKDKQNNC